jgi:transposase-like protein
MSGDFKWRHFVGEIILWAVRWYCKYGVSYRDLEEMMEERGVDLDHTTLYRWVQRYAPELEKRRRWAWRRPTGRWHVDETYIKVRVVDGFISTGLWMSRVRQSISIFHRHEIQKQQAGFSARH